MNQFTKVNLTTGLVFSMLPFTQLNAAEIDDIFSLPIEQLLQLEVASATLTNETLLTVPSSVAVYVEQEIRQMGLTSLDELLNYVTGFQSNQSDRNPRFKRTSSLGRSAGTGGREILILLNGQRVNGEYSGNNDYTFPYIPLAIVEKVEVIKGTGSAIYGSNAFLGVINIITKKNMTPEITLTLGSMDSVELTASGGMQIGEVSLQATAALGQDNGDTYHNERDSFNPNIYHELSDPLKHSEVVINADYRETALHLTYSEQSSDDFYVQGNIGKNFNRTESKTLLITLNHNFNWSDKFNTNVWLDYASSKANLFIQGSPDYAFYEISTPPSTAPLLAKTPFHEDTRGIRIHNFYSLNDWIELSVGVEHRHTHLLKDKSTANYDYNKCLATPSCLIYLQSGGEIKPDEHPDITYFGGDLIENTLFVATTERDINGAFIQSQIKLNENTELTLAVRHDNYSDVGNNTSPRIGIVNNLNKHHTIKFNYGEAYRAPQFNEIGLINNPLILGNPNLNAEKIKSVDFIWLANYQYWSLSTTYFAHRIDDAIIDKVINGTTVSLVNNTDESQSTDGFELETIIAPSPKLNIKIGLTHFFNLADDQFKESKNLAYFITNYHDEKWNYNFSLNYQSEKQTLAYMTQENSLVTLDSFISANAKISYQVSTNANLFIKSKNLFNENYRTPALVNTVEMGIPNRGRQWFIGGDYHF